MTKQQSKFGKWLNNLIQCKTDHGLWFQKKKTAVVILWNCLLAVKFTGINIQSTSKHRGDKLKGTPLVHRPTIHQWFSLALNIPSFGVLMITCIKRVAWIARMRLVVSGSGPCEGQNNSYHIHILLILVKLLQGPIWGPLSHFYFSTHLGLLFFLQRLTHLMEALYTAAGTCTVNYICTGKEEKTVNIITLL